MQNFILNLILIKSDVCAFGLHVEGDFMGKEIQRLEERKSLFYEIFCVGFKEAVKSSLGIFKIMLPVSLLMAILNYVGIVDWLSILFQPITNLLGLSGKAILPLL